MSNASVPDDHNRGGMTAFLFSMVFVFLFFIYIVAIHPGVNLEENVRDPAKEAPADSGPAYDPASNPEPWLPNEKMVAAGAKLFKANCVMCHGEKGMGDGPAGLNLNPRPRNLVEGKWTKGAGTIAHFKVVTGGIPGSSMASYANMAVANRWALVQFVESITQNKGNETPAQLQEFGKTAK